MQWGSGTFHKCLRKLIYVLKFQLAWKRFEDVFKRFFLDIPVGWCGYSPRLLNVFQKLTKSAKWELVLCYNCCKGPKDPYIFDSLHLFINASLFVLFDLSAALDTIDHKTHLYRLKSHFGITGKPLDWMTSYLSGRYQTVYFDGELSEAVLMKYSGPQGSVLGPKIT